MVRRRTFNPTFFADVGQLVMAHERLDDRQAGSRKVSTDEIKHSTSLHLRLAFSGLMSEMAIYRQSSLVGDPVGQEKMDGPDAARSVEGKEAPYARNINSCNCSRDAK